MDDDSFLKRYTDIPAIIYLLKNKAITMLDPKSWDDKNDMHYLEEYKSRKSLKTLLVLCFTGASETYHHWKVYAGGTSGVCITFRRAKLLAVLDNNAGIAHRRVRYLTLQDRRNDSIPMQDLPFVKRYGFIDEKEYRIVYECQNQSQLTRDIRIPLSCIERITMNPWIAKSLSDVLKETIRSFDGCNNIKLGRSTLINNLEWKKMASRVRGTTKGGRATKKK